MTFDNRYFKNRYMAMLLCGAVIVVSGTDAMAKPHKRRHADASHSATITPAGQDDRHSAQNAVSVPAEGETRIHPAPAIAEGETRIRGRRGRPVELGYAKVSAASSDLVAEARRHLGGNPTGRGSLWCGAFMDLVLKRTGRRGGGNLARGYANYGTRVSGPQVGAIAVMTRKGGGHVGVVTGVDSSGNPVIISGNHNNRVEESVYPRGRVITYVVPNE